VRVEVVVFTAEGERRALATTLGAGGLFVATDAPPPAGTPLEVAFRLPEDGLLRRLAARVVWALPPAQAGAGRSPGMGLAFTDPLAVSDLAHAMEASLPDGR
jgi:uncharacterized protein (TIGR02266 family)